MNRSKVDVMISVVKHRESSRFDWAKWNCALAAAEIVRATTGKDYSAGLWDRRKKATAKDCLKWIKDNGGLDAVADRFFSRIQPQFARRGDLVMIGERLRDQSLGIVYDGIWSVFPARKGWTYIKTGDCRHHWRVE